MVGSLKALLPALLLLAFGGWCGTFEAGATAWGALAAHGLLLSAACAAGERWRDPWQLGGWWAGLPWVMVAWVGFCRAFSPVPRAGWVGWLLLPALVLLPAVVARCRGEGRARRGHLALCSVVVGVAGWAVVEWLLGNSPRLAAPLGQHNFLAAWLVMVAPLTLAGVADRAPWVRWVSGFSATCGAAALLGTQSLSGALALGAAGLVLLLGAGRPRARWVLVGLGLLALLGVVFGPRVLALGRGADPSFQARQVYWQGGFEGVVARPVLGWGPGSTAWTLAVFTQPRPGVNPPSEVVGELHLLPLAVAYELGAPGLMLGLVLVGRFAWCRARELLRWPRPERWPALGGLAGLAGGLVAGLGTADWRVLALPVAAAVAAGAALPGAPAPAAARRGRWVLLLYTLCALGCLIPLDRAHLLYRRAALGPPADAARWLAAAHHLDPNFPLYRARQGWWLAERGAPEAAEVSFEAAQAAVGVPGLWAAAGSLGARSGAPWAAEAATAACRLDRLSPLGPWALLELDPTSPEAPARASRALVAEPRLGASDFWVSFPALWPAALRALEQDEGLDRGYRAASLAAFAAAPPTGEPLLWTTTWDRSPAVAASLFTFRREPWRAELAPVRFRADGARALAAQPSGLQLQTTDFEKLTPVCRGTLPQPLRKMLWKAPPSDGTSSGPPV